MIIIATTTTTEQSWRYTHPASVAAAGWMHRNTQQRIPSTARRDRAHRAVRGGVWCGHSEETEIGYALDVVVEAVVDHFTAAAKTTATAGDALRATTIAKNPTTSSAGTTAATTTTVTTTTLAGTSPTKIAEWEVRLLDIRVRLEVAAVLRLWYTKWPHATHKRVCCSINGKLINLLKMCDKYRCLMNFSCRPLYPDRRGSRTRYNYL